MKHIIKGKRTPFIEIRNSTFSLKLLIFEQTLFIIIKFKIKQNLYFVDINLIKYVWQHFITKFKDIIKFNSLNYLIDTCKLYLLG